MGQKCCLWPLKKIHSNRISSKSIFILNTKKSIHLIFTVWGKSLQNPMAVKVNRGCKSFQVHERTFWTFPWISLSISIIWWKNFCNEMKKENEIESGLFWHPFSPTISHDGFMLCIRFGSKLELYTRFPWLSQLSSSISEHNSDWSLQADLRIAMNLNHLWEFNFWTVDE